MANFHEKTGKYHEGDGSMWLKICSVMMVVFLTCNLVTFAAVQPKYVFVHINQKQFSAFVGEQNPYINKEGRVMVPVRIITHFGVNVDDVYQDFKKLTVSVDVDDLKLSLAVGQTTMEFNEQTVVLECAPQKVRESIFVPLRALSESFGAKVHYEHSTKKVFIYFQ
jgi:hypothetical protein